MLVIVLSSTDDKESLNSVSTLSGLVPLAKGQVTYSKIELSLAIGWSAY